MLGRDIASLLRTDARLAFAAIARALDITESRARRTATAMFASGLLRPRVEVEPQRLGYDVEVVLSIRCPPHAVGQLTSVLVDHPATRFLALTGGEAIITYGGVFRDEQQLGLFLVDDLGEIRDVAAVECSVQLDVLKRYWAVRPR